MVISRPQRPHLPALGPGIQAVKGPHLLRGSFRDQVKLILPVPVQAAEAALRIRTVKFPLWHSVSGKKRQYTLSLTPERRFRADHLTERGQNIHNTDKSLLSPSLGCNPRPSPYKRDTAQNIRQVRALSYQSAFPHKIAVVGEKKHDRLFLQSPLFQPLYQPLKLVINQAQHPVII